MADRHFPIVTGQFYHIFNRGVAKQPTFLSKRDYEQVMLALSYYRFKNIPVKLSRVKELSSEERNNLLLKLIENDQSLVKVISFVFMPNHFHFLLQQVQDNGIATFIAKFSNSYTKYFNTKQDRVGPIFQGVYKAIHVETDEQLIHLSRYIHLNPVASSVIRESDLLAYPWSSLPDYLSSNPSLAYTKLVLEQFSSNEDYKKFVLDQIDYGKRLEEIKHLTLEN